MNRREFLNRLAALGLVAATPKLIFDMGANKGRIPELEEWIDPCDPFARCKRERLYVVGNIQHRYWFSSGQEYTFPSPK